MAPNYSTKKKWCTIQKHLLHWLPGSHWALGIQQIASLNVAMAQVFAALYGRAVKKVHNVGSALLHTTALQPNLTSSPPLSLCFE